MAEVTEQIVREAPDIEAYKLGLLKSAKAQAESKVDLPAYQVQGLTQAQRDALAAGQQGIGAYAPYLQGGTQAVQAGTNALGEAADVLRGADTREQFAAAQQAYNAAAAPAAALGNLSNVAGSGLGYISGAGQDFDYAQRMALASSQADLAPGQRMMTDSVNQAQGAGPQFGEAKSYLSGAAEQAAYAANQPGFDQGIRTLGAGATQGQVAANQPGFGQAKEALGMGIGALQGAAQGYDPTSAQGFMNPYQQQVIDQALQQINRQKDIQQQSLQAQAARAGAFGGSRDAIQRAELERSTQQTRNQAILSALQQGYGSAQQQAQQAFEQQQQRQLAQGQGLQGAAGTAGSLASQQGGLGMQAAGLTQNVGQAELSAAGQKGQLGLGAAGQTAQVGSQLGNMEAQRANQALQTAQYAGNIGQYVMNFQNQGKNRGGPKSGSSSVPTKRWCRWCSGNIRDQELKAKAHRHRRPTRRFKAGR